MEEEKMHICPKQNRHLCHVRADERKCPVTGTASFHSFVTARQNNLNAINKKKEVVTIYQRMLQEYKKIESKLNELEVKLQQMPPGSLVCTQNGNYAKWYVRDGDLAYIPKKGRAFAEKLAYKKYLTSLYEDLLHEKRAIQFYLEHHSQDNKSQELLESKEFQKLLSTHFIPLSKELSDWMKEPYETNPNHVDNLIHRSLSGNLVRSKSESMIDAILYANKIPFRYENLLQLGETILYPDFTIRHPKTGMLYYWEHFGLMDNPAYAQKACSKLQIYTSFGIIPSIQLITTYETKDNPISIDMIEKIIAYYFL